MEVNVKMIRYSNDFGFIKAKGIKFRKGQNPKIQLPKIAIGVFSRHLFDDVIEKFSSLEVGYISGANLERNVFIIKYKEHEFTFFMAGVSGAWISADIEELVAQGVKKFIIFGNCGVLDRNIKDCFIIIPTKAFREDGASYHYKEESETIDLNPKYINEFIEILKKHDFDYTKGYTWTIDTFYRETNDKIKYFKNNGAICVEMEGASIAAVCEYLNVDYFTFYYAGDNLDSAEWDERSLSGLVNIDRKKQVMTLALELARYLDKSESE